MLNGLLDETKCFEYQIFFFASILQDTKALKLNFLQFSIKSMINHNLDLKIAFQEILYSIERWVNEGYVWIIEKTYSQHINISTFRSLSGISYIKLPTLTT